MSGNALHVQVRTFVAIELPPPVLATLDAVQRQVEAAQLPLRLAAIGGLHLTLAFIGEIPAQRVPDLVVATRNGCAGIAPIPLRAEGVGMFPNARAPRVVWAGVGGDGDAQARLQTLYTQLMAALDGAGFPANREHTFTPHLTLARVRDHAAPDDRARIGPAVGALTLPATPFLADTVSVMRSDLQSSGAVYTALAQIALSGDQTAG
jgi:2'-5' RNA ligase